MKTKEFEIAYSENKTNIKTFPVVVVAAGLSSRMNGINKQFAKIGGIPVIARTLMVFESNPNISKIVVVAHKDNILKLQNICQEYSITKLCDIVVGGENRQQSVTNGLNCLKGESKVLIHDGARPLVSQEIINNVCNELSVADGVVCAVPVKDTIKSVNNNCVKTTLNREELVLAQTPQGVNIDLYFNGLKNNKIFTDDVSVLEEQNIAVKIVKGSYKNIKITTPEDIILAELLIENTEEN